MIDGLPYNWLRPGWPAPPQVRALTTTRQGGFSKEPYAGLNLATHVGDSSDIVASNREHLRDMACLPNEPVWLIQTHGTDVAELSEDSVSGIFADAAITDRPNVVCAVLTADCLPVMFCDESGQWVGVAHAGWRGLASGILTATINRFDGPPSRLLAWMGPAIGPASFEVGGEVHDAFLEQDLVYAQAFRKKDSSRWYADLYAIARLQLAISGLERVYGGGFCTMNEPGRFYSYRRDGVTGRMASLIWLHI